MADVEAPSVDDAVTEIGELINKELKLDAQDALTKEEVKDTKDANGNDADEEVDKELMEEMKEKDLTFYAKMKDMPDSVCKKYLPDLKRRWQELEERVPALEKLLMDLNPPERSLEEDRFEILGELLDKAAQGFEINDEHENRRIRLGHRLVLESRLMALITMKFDLICKIVAEFDKLKDDRDGANNEREWLRYEIRHCDMEFYEVHELFLKSYLDQWE